MSDAHTAWRREQRTARLRALWPTTLLWAPTGAERYVRTRSEVWPPLRIPDATRRGIPWMAVLLSFSAGVLAAAVAWSLAR